MVLLRGPVSALQGTWASLRHLKGSIFLAAFGHRGPNAFPSRLPGTAHRSACLFWSRGKANVCPWRLVPHWSQLLRLQCQADGSCTGCCYLQQCPSRAEPTLPHGAGWGQRERPPLPSRQASPRANTTGCVSLLNRYLRFQPGAALCSAGSWAVHNVHLEARRVPPRFPCPGPQQQGHVLSLAGGVGRHLPG